MRHKLMSRAEMKSLNDLTQMAIVVPIDLENRPLDIIKKTIRMCTENDKRGGHLVIGLADRDSWIERIFKKIISRFSNTTVVATPFSGPVNTARLRNKAFEAVERQYLLLLDVDIWPDFNLFAKYQRKLSLGTEQFCFIPCMYLSQYGSKRLITEGRANALRESYFNFSRKEFLHLANPSSITIMHSQDYSMLGGFDERFEGHGYEDFDFMMRLAEAHNCLQPCGNLLDANTARSPLFPSGFRRALGRLCLQALLDKDMAFHLHHKSPKNTKYYSSRQSNLEFFLAQHQHRAIEAPESNSLIEDFLGLCKANNLNYKDYSALFENKPGHIDRYDTFKRRLRFLLNG